MLTDTHIAQAKKSSSRSSPSPMAIRTKAVPPALWSAGGVLRDLFSPSADGLEFQGVRAGVLFSCEPQVVSAGTQRAHQAEAMV